MSPNNKACCADQLKWYTIDSLFVRFEEEFPANLGEGSGMDCCFVMFVFLDICFIPTMAMQCNRYVVPYCAIFVFRIFKIVFFSRLRWIPHYLNIRMLS